MKINKIVSQSRVAEVSGTANRIVVAHGESGLTMDETLTSMFIELSKEAALLTKALNSCLAESDLDVKDSERDEVCRAIYHSLNGYLYNPDPTISLSAKIVLAIFNNYGIAMLQDSYNVESAKIKSYLGDMKDEDIAAEIDNLPGFATLLENLDMAEKKFGNYQSKWEQAKAESSLKEPASVIKTRVVEVINTKLITYLKAMILVDMDKYGSFVAKLSEIIETNNVVVRKRAN